MRLSHLCTHFFPYQLLDSEVSRYLSKIGFPEVHYSDQLASSFEVVCNKKPENAQLCQPLVSPCLFDIEKDPCEYNNLAGKIPGVVQDLLDLLNWYNSTAVPPINTPPDSLSNPKFWNYTFTNWVDFL